MTIRRLGRSGLRVSELCLGTMTFGHGTDEAEAIRMVDVCLEAGVNLFDTADAYAGGNSERILGKALKGRRRNTLVATKFFNPMGRGPNDSGMSRAYLMRAIEHSLTRLQTDYVDIYYIHHVDIQTPMEEMLRSLDDLVRCGKVRYIACSNHQAWRLATALGISDANGLARFVCYQPQYNLVVRDIEQELVPLCQYHGLGIVCWAPLAGGFLSGKYAPGVANIAGTRSAENWCFPRENFADNADRTLAVLIEVARELGRSAAQVALRWLIERPGVTSAIVGARKVENLKDNLGAVGWDFPSAALDRLTEVSAPRVRYPESMERTMKHRRDSAVGRP